MRHPRYCLKHQPGISFNITNSTQFSMSPMPPTLALHPRHTCWTITHASNIGTPLTLPMLAHQASTPPT